MEVDLERYPETKKYELKVNTLGFGDSAITKFSLNSRAEDHPDSFFKSMRTVVFLGQIFSLLPVSGLTGPNYKSLQFKWVHWKTFLSLISIFGIFFLFACSLNMSLKYGFSYDRSTSLVFFGSEVIASILILQLATKWRKMNEQFAEVEFKFSKYEYPKRIGFKFNILIAVFMVIALVEHGLAKAVDFVRVQPCSEIEDDPASIFKAFIINSYYQVYCLVPYNWWSGIIVLYCNFLSTFTWNYTDLFLALISLSLSQRFKQLNKSLFLIQGQNKPPSFWKTVREDYNELSVLTKKVDNHLQKLMLLSMADNLYFICLQLLKSLKKRIVVIQIVYFFWSFGFLILRTAFVAFCAADIHDQSKEAKTVIYSVPQESYCSETKRFLTQLTTNEIALTGCRFFSVTRGLILTIAGTVITYEIVLVQFNTDIGVEAWPTKFNKTFCAKL